MSNLIYALAHFLLLDCVKIVPSDFDNLGFRERMQRCVERCGNQNQLAKRAGVALNTLRRYFTGSEPTRPMIIALAQAANVSESWLLSGSGPMSLTGSEASADTGSVPEIANHRPSKLEEYIRLPRVVGSRLDETGQRTLLYDSLDAFLPRQWIAEGMLGINPDDLAVFIVNGEEMEPEIHDHEMLLIDTKKAERFPGDGRRLVRLYEKLCIRTLLRTGRDTFTVRHRLMTTDSEAMRFNMDRLGQEIDVLGRVALAVRRPLEYKSA